MKEVAASLNTDGHDEVVIHMDIDCWVLFDVDQKFIESVEGILNFCKHIDEIQIGSARSSYGYGSSIGREWWAGWRKGYDWDPDVSNWLEFHGEIDDEITFPEGGLVEFDRGDGGDAADAGEEGSSD